MHKLKWGVLVPLLCLFSLFVLFYSRLNPSAIAPTQSSERVALRAVSNTPTGSDPLTEEEQTKILDAAQQGLQGAAIQSAKNGTLELLWVERHQADKNERTTGNWVRQGDVYFYDYRSDTLIHSIVDVQSGKVVAVEHLQGVQLPLTVNEEARALELIRADSSLWSDLAQRYQSISGEPLEDFSPLQVKVSLFLGDSMPDRVNESAKNCGQHRCAQALIFTVDKTLLEIMPIVDLSTAQVVQVIRNDN